MKPPALHDDLGFRLSIMGFCAMTFGFSARSPEAVQDQRRAVQLWDATMAAYATRTSYRDEGEVEIIEPGSETERARFVPTFRGRDDLRFEFTSMGVTRRLDRSSIVVRAGRVSIVEMMREAVAHGGGELFYRRGRVDVEW